MTKSRHIVIHEWMLDYGLKGSELLAYALIWGFSQDGDSDFHGAASYVARWCGVQRRQALDILRSLVDRGLVIKAETPGQPARYRVAMEGGCAIIAPVQKLHGGCAEIAPLPPTPPIPDTKEKRNREREFSAGAREEKVSFGDKVQMTADEHAALVQRFGATDAARLVQILDDYLVNHPRKTYASHYRAILSWCVRELAEQKTVEQRLKNAQEAGARVNGQQQGAPVGNYVGLAEAKARREAIEAKYKLKQ